jgi:hypothetical protein
MLPNIFKGCIIVLFWVMNSQTAPRLIASGFEFPEGPAWDGQKNVLYCSNCYGDWLALVSQNEAKVFLNASHEPFKIGRASCRERV